MGWISNIKMIIISFIGAFISFIIGFLKYKNVKLERELKEKNIENTIHKQNEEQLKSKINDMEKLYKIKDEIRKNERQIDKVNIGKLNDIENKLDSNEEFKIEL